YAFFAPTNTANGKMYNRLSRFEADPTNPLRALRASEQILFDLEDESSVLHNGGDLHFGPDGYLYVTMGDEGDQLDVLENSQKIDKDLFSSILRLDVDKRPGSLPPNAHPAINPDAYRIPPDNPYIGATSFNGLPVDPLSVRTEFWAVGFRSPHRMSFDPLTGEIYLGDVGSFRVEEVNRVVRGGNYGWSYFEGNLPAYWRPGPPPGIQFNAPIHTYGRLGLNPEYEGRAAIGGLVYRGTRYPELTGRYVFGDYISKHIWALTFQPGGGYAIERIVTAELGPTTFGLDPATGEILIANPQGISRLVRNPDYVAPAFPPTLSAVGAFSDLATLTPQSGVRPYEVASPFWSDYAIKRRWFFFQDPTNKVTRNAADQWAFPTGMVWMKHFDLDLVRGDPTSRRRVETRFLVKTTDSVYGLSYRWRADGSDADLVGESGANDDFAIQEGGATRTQRWHYPARSECLSCHNRTPGYVLGFNTQQLNRSVLEGGIPMNQLTLLSDLGVLDPPIVNPETLPRLVTPDDASATVEHRFKSYLDANCSYCHQPGGPGRGDWDGRFRTPLSDAGIIDGPVLDNLGFAGAGIIRLRNTNSSVMWHRIASMDVFHMPPLATSEANPAGINLVREFIESYNPTFRTVWQAGTPAPPGSPAGVASGEFTIQNGSNDLPPGKVTRLPGDPLYSELSNPTADDDFYFSGNYPAAYNGSVGAFSVPNDEPAIAFESALTSGDRTNRLHFLLTAAQVAERARLKIAFKFAGGGEFSNKVLLPGFGTHDVAVNLRNRSGTVTPLYSAQLTQPTEGFIDVLATAAQAQLGPNAVEFIRNGPQETNHGYYVSFDYVRIESVPSTNHTPVLQPPPPVFVDETRSLAVNLTSVDPDLPADTLTYSKVSGPPGLTVGPSGVVTWTPTEADGPSVVPVEVMVIDNGVPPMSSTLSFSITVHETNQPPAFIPPGALGVDELSTLQFTLAATDPDLPANLLTYSKVSGPPGLTVGPSGVVTWTPTEADGPSVVPVEVMVIDDGVPPMSSPLSFSITVHETNQPPVFIPPATLNVDELSTLQFTLAATDPDLPANSLTWSLVKGPSGLSVSTGGAVTWTPDATQGPSTQNVQVLVTDNGSPARSTLGSWDIVVRDTAAGGGAARSEWQIGVNAPPGSSAAVAMAELGLPNSVRDQVPGRVTRLPGDVQYLEVGNPGPDDDFYFAGDYPAGFNGLTLPLRVPQDEPSRAWERAHTLGDPNNRMHFVLDPVQAAGSSPLRLTAEFAFGGFSVGSVVQRGFGEHDLLILFRNGNGVSTPVFNGRLSGASNVVLEFSPATVAATPGPNTLEFVRSGPATAGYSYWLEYDFVRLEVVAQANRPPVPVAVDPVTVDELKPLSLQLAATDPDLPAQALSFSLVSGAEGVSVGGAGLLKWTPREDQGPGRYTNIVSVRDDGIPPMTTEFPVVVDVREVVSSRTVWQIGSDAPPNAAATVILEDLGLPNYRNDAPPGAVTRITSDPLYLAGANPGPDDDYYFEGVYFPGFNSLTGLLNVPVDEPWASWERAHTLGDRTNRMHFLLDSPQVVSSIPWRLTAEFPLAGFTVNGVVQSGYGDHDLEIRFRNGLGVSTPLFSGRLSNPSNVVMQFTSGSVSATPGANSIEFVRTGPAIAGRGYWLEYDYLRLEQVLAAPSVALSQAGWDVSAVVPNLVSNLRAGIVVMDGVEYLAITFDRPQPPPSGYTYRVEASDDLVSWTGEGVASAETLDRGSHQTVVVRDAEPLKQLTQRFLRLRVVAE
ncbi:MAG: PQQ-dependent sugar dehydrogenase, partial [Verrucomicrobiales bacterium]|nr:PQQ-dependent sugar dehydrogenase [Verrucomicrobiales bacterium]